jgi:putative two-component system response regulator
MQLQEEIGADVRQATVLPGWGVHPEEELAQAEQPSTVLILETIDINRQLLRETLKPCGYRLFEASEARHAFRLLEQEKIDLVIVDLVLAGESGLDFCRRMKAGRYTRLIPVLMLTSVQGAESEIAGIASGADEFLVNPVHPEIMRTRIRAMLRHKSAVDSLEEAESILLALAKTVEHRDRETIGHCERLAAMSMTMGMALGLGGPQMLGLYRGAYLHDIGKISIPDAILFKRGKLTAAEWEVMRMHTVRGEEICRPARTLSGVLPIIRHHHERWDGSGYPDGLREEEIPLLARVLQVADIFDALTSVRPYKPALSTAEALDILEAEAARGWRDPKLVGLFRRLFETTVDAAVEQNLIPWPPPEAMEQSLERMHEALVRN